MSGEPFPGSRIQKGDIRYPTMVRGFNPRWVAEPEFVEVCRDTAQVVKVVQRAFDNGKRVTVRSGGHCYEDFACDNVDGVLIDLSAMNAVSQPKVGQPIYCVEGGATLWNVYNELYRKYAVTLPGGSCYSVGVGGHVTGGGYGLLSRFCGLTVDYLKAVEVVRVNDEGKAEAIVVDRESKDPVASEIAWAHTGGGGGNFGIVTKFWFEDPPVAPEAVLLSNLAWNWSELGEAGFATLVEKFGEFFAANSGVDSEFGELFSLLHLTQCSSPSSQIVLTTQKLGTDPALLEEFTGIFDSLPRPVSQRAPVGYHGLITPSTSTRTLQWLFATQALNGETPNLRGKYKSAYMKAAFPSAQIETMWKYLHEQPNPNATQALLQVDSYGCAVNGVGSEETAVAQRSSVMKLQYQTYWLQPAQDDENLAWIRAFYGEMYPEGGPRPDGTMDGCFINYPDVDLEEWQILYYKANYPRLQRAKALCDPKNVFHHQQSIELPTP
jgi:hypothetical protein